MTNRESARDAAGRLGSSASLWLMGLILLTFLAASSVPSPLYGLYRESWGFSALTLTIIFGSYSLAMLGALLVFGTLSDHWGRRSVVFASLVIELVAMALFRNADSVSWLLTARILQGVATGMLTSAIGAGLIDLNRQWGGLINSVAPMVGLGVGALGASLIVVYSLAPTKLAFDVLLVVFVLQAVAACYLPETARRQTGAWRSLVPVIAVPLGARQTMLRVLPVNTAQWALGGLLLSLGPTLTGFVSGRPSPLIGGAAIAVLVFSSALTMVLVRTLEPNKVLASGAAALAVGSILLLAGIEFRWSAIFVVGTAVGGAGFGAAFSSSIRSLIPLAAPHERAALMAVFLASSYVAFSLPAIAAGLFAGRYGLPATSKAYVIGVAVLAALALFKMCRPNPGRKSTVAAPAISTPANH